MFRTRDYLGSDGHDEWRLHRCADCASIFLDPRPDDASIPLTYKSYYTHAAPVAQVAHGFVSRIVWSVINGYLASRFAWDRSPRLSVGEWLCRAFPPLKLKLDYFGRHLLPTWFPRKGILLDIGCGNGEFLRQAVEMGWQAHGVEPDRDATNACRAQGLSVFEGTVAALPAQMLGTVDVVTLSHCIEHVAEPGELVARIFAILKPGGRVWIATPNPEGLGLRIFRSAWRGLEPSRHLCIPSQQQLVRLLASHGFADIQLLRRGAHGKTITRESAAIATMATNAGNRNRTLLPWLALPVRLFASIGGTFTAKWAEETVVVARRGIG